MEFILNAVVLKPQCTVKSPPTIEIPLSAMMPQRWNICFLSSARVAKRVILQMLQDSCTDLICDLELNCLILSKQFWNKTRVNKYYHMQHCTSVTTFRLMGLWKHNQQWKSILAIHDCILMFYVSLGYILPTLFLDIGNWYTRVITHCNIRFYRQINSMRNEAYH